MKRRNKINGDFFLEMQWFKSLKRHGNIMIIFPLIIRHCIENEFLKSTFFRKLIFSMSDSFVSTWLYSFADCIGSNLITGIFSPRNFGFKFSHWKCGWEKFRIVFLKFLLMRVGDSFSTQRDSGPWYRNEIGFLLIFSRNLKKINAY